jgi:hypothetical protein
MIYERQIAIGTADYITGYSSQTTLIDPHVAVAVHGPTYLLRELRSCVICECGYVPCGFALLPISLAERMFPGRLRHGQDDTT